MSFVQSLISRLTEDTPFHSSSTRNSSRNPSNTATYPASLPNPFIPTRSPSHSRSSYTSPTSPPSTFHSLTRTLRSYVPSSIHIPIPSAAPSPPLVSRPVSFGRFSSDSPTSESALGLSGTGNAPRGRKLVSRQEFERDYEREGEQYYDYGRHPYGYGYAQGHQQQQPSASSLARAMMQNSSSGFDTTVNSRDSGAAIDKSSGHAGVAGGIDVIEWARWDVLNDRSVPFSILPFSILTAQYCSRFLILAYLAGLQIWDCSDLSAISEVLNLNFDSAEWRMVLGNGKGGSTRRQEEGIVVQVIHAAFLPAPTQPRLDTSISDPFGGYRPLLGILYVLTYLFWLILTLV